MTPVKLSVLTLADRHLRFCLMDRDNRFYNCSNMHATGCQPLFLGSDILRDTPEWGKNLCRIHARFAKQGLATKLVFTDCRIDGLRKGNEAYFYSVHGLFRAAFEYRSFPVQHRCLQLLTDVWMKASEESQPRLEGQYQVTFQNQVPAPCQPAPAAAGQRDAECEHNAPAPPMLPSLKAQPIPSIASKLCGPGAASDHSSTNARPDSSSARSLVKEPWTTLAPSSQDVGTHAGDPSDWASDSQEAVVLETVCQMCRIRRRMTEREKADVDSLCRSAKRRKSGHSLEGEESVCDVNRSEMTGMVSDTVSGDKTPEKGERVSGKVMAMLAPDDDGQAEVGSRSDSQVSAQTVSDDPPMKNVHQDFLQTNHVDAALRVQSWLEEVYKMKVLLNSDNAETSTCSAGQTCEDSADAVKASGVQGVQLEVMLVVLEFLSHIVDGVTTSSDVSIFSQILMLIQSAAEKSAKFAAASREWPVASALRLSVLTELGAWLGEQFHLFQAAISQRVTAFKQKHINNISDLPPAIDMIAELFPSCMVVFTRAWIGLADAQVAEAIEKDHCYENPSRALPENQPPKRNPYPLVQLVLELLNNSLVSGIAHVVFCKL